MDQASEPLLAFHILDVAEHLPPQQLARFEAGDGLAVGADALALAVDELEGVHEVGACDGGGGDGLEELGFFFFEVEGFGILFGFGFGGFDFGGGGGGGEGLSVGCCCCC